MAVTGVTSNIVSQLQSTEPQSGIRSAKAEYESEIEKFQSQKSENVNMQAGLAALKEAVENDPVANFISYLA